MKLELLDSLHDDELKAVIARAGELLKQHDKERKDKALEAASAILAAAGLNIKDVARKGKPAKGKGPAYRAGHHYQHPVKKDLVWNAKGQKPNWLRELEKEGGKAVELAVALSA
jgi:DNA-binding protein H-NS